MVVEQVGIEPTGNRSEAGPQDHLLPLRPETERYLQKAPAFAVGAPDDVPREGGVRTNFTGGPTPSRTSTPESVVRVVDSGNL